MRKLIIVAGALLAGALAQSQGTQAAQDTRMVGDKSYSRIQRGEYLARAADCAACHTSDNGKPYAGGRPIPTPFGTIYSSNITPDRDTGIGGWSPEDFYRALHEGIGRGGEHLYPAMPYPWYTRITREDAEAIRIYLETLAPVRNAVKPPDLPWPLSWRGAMSAWNDMFFKPGEFHPDASKSAEWNRGAYLVQGAGHCGACHTAKNMLGAAKTDDRLGGGDAGEHWYAPALAGDMRAGLGAWSIGDIVQYLKTGASAHTAAAGPMVDVIRDSTSHLDDADLRAIAVYLKDMPAPRDASSDKGTRKDIDSRRMMSGAALYQDQCAACHMQNGRGLPQVFPSLAGSSAVQAQKPDTVVHMILAGGEMAGTAQRPVRFGMPPFDGKLSDAQIADLATYVRNAWGNHASPVDATAVQEVRKTKTR